MSFKIITSKSNLSALEFVELSKSVLWGVNNKYDMEKVDEALIKSSLIVTIRNEEGEAIACGRALSDDMFFTTIPDVFVHPDYQKKGLGKIIMNKITKRFEHTKIFFGAKPESQGFFEKLGFKKDLQSYSNRNYRNNKP